MIRYIAITFISIYSLFANEGEKREDVKDAISNVMRIKTRFTFYPEHYITGPRSSRELILQGYCDNVLNVLNENPVHVGRVWYQGIKLRDELQKPIPEKIELPMQKPSKITYYYFSTGL
ncbi:MAG: hypothetical protein VX260_02300 [Candidatus Neomarinimicrobiota bacterium]|nr:hypothetical protein [Candidatus Neomarinimicrobiota bacterium]|tara:strand:+ start:378 stop:734 length:357 start_codon:yes stop_codon:yes gene_type:complete